MDSEICRLSDNHKAAIETAINQINNGEFLTSEQANKEINEWLTSFGRNDPGMKRTL